MSIKDIQALVEQLTEACDAYYNSDPLMSDAEYDALYDQLYELDPTNSFFKQVGAKPKDSKWKKAKHGIPMGSLNKVQTPAEMCDWLQDLVRKTPKLQKDSNRFVVSEKLDGISISLKYENGKLVQAVTRGNGSEGEDITRNVKLMQGVCAQARDYTGYVRGEIILTKTAHQGHLSEYKNLRNAASGIAKRESDSSSCKHLTVIAYQMISNSTNFPNKVTEFRVLEKLGFKTPNWKTGQTINLVLDTYTEYVDGVRKDLDYDIDGLVVECNDPEVMEELGVHGGRPKGAVAFKFPHDVGSAFLLPGKDGVAHQVGPTGRITPVAYFTPLSLAGATVSRASLSNYDEVKRLGLRYGSEVQVSRRNDVIPKVEKVISGDGPEVEAPATCPSCDTPTEKDGAYVLCPNTATCPAQQVGAVKRWVTKLDIKELGDSVIRAALESDLIKDIADLYVVTDKQWGALTMDGRRVGDSTGRKITMNLAMKAEIPLGDLVGSLGIPLCGQTVCNALVDAGYDTLDKMEDATVRELADLSGMGGAKAKAFVDGFRRRYALIQRLLNNGVSIKKKAVGKFTGMSFCFTGIRDKSLEARIKDEGGTIKGSVGKSLTYLVAKDPSSTSGKAKKARDNGVSVIGLDDLEKML